MNKSSEKIIELIKQNSEITTSQLSEVLEVSTEVVEKHISKLRKQNKIVRIGADKGGYWEII